MASEGGRMRGKTVLVVGGGAGIGAASSRLFACEGAGVAVADIDEAAAKAVAAKITAGGGCAVAFQADATSDDSMRALLAGVLARFGALHSLFYCAGGSLPEDAPVTKVDLSVWESTMGLDARGALLCARHAIPAIIAAGGGTVVMMSSGAALRGSGKAHVYAAAKGAVVSFTRAMAGTYARDNVRVNAICSGRVNTERIRRTYGIPGKPGAAEDALRVDEQVKMYPFWFGEPEDIANIALFLACDESRMITGAAIPADGGRSAY